MKVKNSRIRFLFVLLSTVCLILTVAGQLHAEDKTFPVYPSIKPNVDFWKKIYTEYHSKQGVIHDNQTVSIIYEVIELVPRNVKKSRRINSRRIKQAKQKYRKILDRLAKGAVPLTAEETGVLKLFRENSDPITLMEARNRIRFQRGQKDRFKDGLIRSSKYLDRIKSIIKKQGLPEDLAYLPHVESSFNYNAYSKFGAAGIWQFTYGTGKRFMRINYTVDERRDPIRSTYAAAKLLKINYSKLGSWALAITAYNHGASSMIRAKKAKGDYETIFNEYEGRRFKFASKNFYSEFLAAREIANDSEKYFGKLKTVSPIPSREIKLTGFIAVSSIVKHFKVRQKTVQELNPALRRSVYRGQKYIPKGYSLRLPFTKNLNQLVSTLDPNLFKPKQKRSRFYWVRKGDNAGKIARRHGISLKELIWANNLNRKATIYVGQNLRIPTDEDIILLAAKHTKVVSSPKQAVQSKKKEGKRLLSSVAANGTVYKTEINPAVVTGNLMVQRVFKKKKRLYGVIRVNTRETLGHYADWLSVTAQRLRKLNGFSFEQGIQYNDRIVIPFIKVSRDQFEEKRYEYHKEFEEDFLAAYKIENVWVYEIKQGDSIWKLCKNRFDLPFWLIKKYNSEIDLRNLKPLQKIIVPVVEERI